MRHRPTDRQTDGQTNKTDFIGPFPQSERFDHVLPKFENKSPLTRKISPRGELF